MGILCFSRIYEESSGNLPVLGSVFEFVACHKGNRGNQRSTTYDAIINRFAYSPLSCLQLRNSLLMDVKDMELIKLEKRKLDVWQNSMLEIPLIMVVYGNG